MQIWLYEQLDMRIEGNIIVRVPGNSLSEWVYHQPQLTTTDVLVRARRSVVAGL